MAGIPINHVMSCAEAGTIISAKTAESQMIGGGVGGIGMALMEEKIIDHRFGRPINNNLADYHVPVNADNPNTDVLFVTKKILILIPSVQKVWMKLLWLVLRRLLPMPFSMPPENAFGRCSLQKIN